MLMRRFRLCMLRREGLDPGLRRRQRYQIRARYTIVVGEEEPPAGQLRGRDEEEHPARPTSAAHEHSLSRFPRGFQLKFILFPIQPKPQNPNLAWSPWLEKEMTFLLRLAGYRLVSQRSLSSSSISLLRRYSLSANRDDSGDQELEMFDQRKLPSDYDPANFDPTEHRTPPSDRVWRLVDEVSSLTLSEVAELSAIIMRKASLSEPPVIGVMKPGTAFPSASATSSGAASSAKEEEKPEKTMFDLKLESFEAASKIKVIKEVRSFTDLGLKEAKELVEKTPTVIKTGVSKEEAEQIIEKLKAAGAKVIME